MGRGLEEEWDQDRGKASFMEENQFSTVLLLPLLSSFSDFFFSGPVYICQETHDIYTQIGLIREVGGATVYRSEDRR